MADEEPVCPKPELEAACKPKCIKYWLEYQGCQDRIKDDKTGEAHCTGQYFDYWQCIDKCAAPKLFKLLK